MQSTLLSKCRAPEKDGLIQKVTPESAGWEYVGFEAYIFKPGQGIERDTGDREVCLVVIGGAIRVRVDGVGYGVVGGRKTQFDKTPPYAVYVPPGKRYTVKAESDAELAVCSAPGLGKFPPRLISPADIAPQKRGRGRNTRLVHNILADNDAADSLLVVEVFTDEGNTSSYPSHKHDRDDGLNETYLEETYYHRFNPPQGWGFQRVYVDDRSLDECMAVYDRDVVMVPKGYHPVAAIAGYDNYYLNVMAGPRKQWRFTWEKDHAWINTDAYV